MTATIEIETETATATATATDDTIAVTTNDALASATIATTATNTTTTATTTTSVTVDAYSLQVKPEYILQERHSSLAPVETSPPEQQQPRRGQTKKRPRDTIPENETKACLAIVRGETCPFEATKCRFSHDLPELVRTRPEDIPHIDHCPKFHMYGFCEFGLLCRVGASHCNLVTGENVRREPLSSSVPQSQPLTVTNIMSKELQTMLRKKKFPFQTSSQTTTDFDTKTPPLPPTERHCAMVDFRNKVYVAPLTTVGNLPFRRIMKQYGADITCGEMALATNLLEGKAQEWALLKRHASEDVFGIQIAGAYPDQFTKVAELINEFVKVDFVDLNLGCPLDMLCNKGAGAGLMMREKRLKGSIIGIVNTLHVPITVKMRTGWDEAKPFAHDLVTKIREWDVGGISAIMIHGRSRLQRYQKLAKWDYIQRVATCQTDIPIIGNGDIFSFTDYEEKIANCPNIVPCAMLGRGALIKPWLPTEIKERRHWDISATERFDILKDFVKFGLEHWGSDNMGVNKTRRFLLEWISFLHRYVPVGLLEVIPQQMNHRPPLHMYGRNDLETLMMSRNAADWINLSEMLLGKVSDDFQFEPKHKANSYK